MSDDSSGPGANGDEQIPRLDEDQSHELSHQQVDESVYQSPPRKGQQRKLEDTEFKDSPRVERVWSQRRDEMNAKMSGRVGPDGLALGEEGGDAAPATPGIANQQPSGTPADPFDFRVSVARGKEKPASALDVLASTAARAGFHPQQRFASQGGAQPREDPARRKNAPEGGVGGEPDGVQPGPRAAARRATPPHLATGEATTPPLPPSTVASRLALPQKSTVQRAEQLSSGAPRAQQSPAPVAPGGFLPMETDESFARRMGGSAQDPGSEAMDVDAPAAPRSFLPGLGVRAEQQRAITVFSDFATPAPAPVKVEEEDAFMGLEDGLEEPGGADEDPTAHIYNPAPATDEDRVLASRYSPRFANTKIKVAALGRTQPCTDGHLTGARSANLNPPTASRWRARRLQGEPGVGIHIHSIGGDMNIAAINPARLKIEITEAFQLLLPEETPRVAPALGVHGGAPMPPGTFNVDSIHDKTAADLKDIEFLVVGRICMVVFDWDHGNSDFMGTFGEAVFTVQELEDGLKANSKTSPEIRAVFRTLESRYPGYGAQAKHRFCESIKAAPLSMTARGASWIGYDELNVYARTSGLIPADEHGRPQELPGDLLASLRAAFATLIFEEDDVGRAVMRPEYNCVICLSKSHPTGKCPALALEGWPMPAEGRRGRGPPGPPPGGPPPPNMPIRGGQRNRGGSLGRGAPAPRGAHSAPGSGARGTGAFYRWEN